MGRKSLQTERRAQILDACETVVLEEGLAAASPARLAREVGLDRSTLHHYFRTRADLLAGLVERLIDGYLAGVPALPEPAGLEHAGEEILEFLFSPDFLRPRQDRIVFEMSAAAHGDPAVRAQLVRLYQSLEATCVEGICKMLPDVDPDRARETAQALYALVEGAYLLHSVGLPEDRLVAARNAAQQLVRALRDEGLDARAD
jgi:AcrR family transcriptional regulator